MSKAKQLADLLNNPLLKQLNQRGEELFKEKLAKKDPSIDWALVRTIGTLNGGDLGFVSNDLVTESKLQAAMDTLKQA